MRQWIWVCLIPMIVAQSGCVEPDPTGIGAHLSNKQAETAFKRLGGQIHVLAKSDERLAVSLRMFDQEVSVEALRVARSFWRVFRIDFERCTLPQVWIDALPTFEYVRELALRESGITDEDFIPIAEGPHFGIMRVLDLTRTKVSDQSLAALPKDAGLEVLGLTQTNVSDEGLHYLVPLEDLRTVHLKYTQVTESGMKWLQSQRPDLEIKWAPPVEDPMPPYLVNPNEEN